MLDTKIQNFQNWILTNSTLSTRAKRDVVSRLRRAFKLSSFEFNVQLDDFLLEIRRNPNWHEIPESSRAGIERSVRMFYRYLAESENDTV